MPASLQKALFLEVDQFGSHHLLFDPLPVPGLTARAGGRPAALQSFFDERRCGSSKTYEVALAPSIRPTSLEGHSPCYDLRIETVVLLEDVGYSERTR